MKKFLLLSLLGLGLLLPSTDVSAKGHNSKKVIHVTMENAAYVATSETQDGPINLIEIRTMPEGKLVISQTFSDYIAAVDVSGLPSGLYVGRVYATYRSCEKQFKK